MPDEIFTYMNLQSTSKPKVIPKTEQITFLSSMSGLPQVWMIDSSRKPKIFVEFNDTVRNIYHSPKGEQSIISMDHNGNEKEQFYLFDHATKEVEPLVESLKHFHYFGGWSPDGQSIVYASNRRSPGHFDLYLLDVANKDVQTIFSYDGICRPITWLKDGKHLLINIPESGLDQKVYILNINTGNLSRFGNEKKSARYHSFALTKDQTGGYVITDAGENTKYISSFSIKNPNKLEKIIHPSKGEIEELRLTPDESKIIYTVNKDGYYKLFIYDINKKTSTQIKNLPAGVIESFAFLNNDEFIFNVNTPTIAGDLWKYNFRKGLITRLTYISHKGSINHQLIEPELHAFKSFDGLKVPYFYYAKDSCEEKPTVIYVHGGPASQTRAEFNYYIQYLVHQGFAVVAPNVRGSSGYGREYLALDDVRRRMDSVKDLVFLVDELIETHRVNKNKIGIMGRSYGGFMTLAATTHYPDLWAAAVNIVGISSLETFMQTTGEWRRKLRGAEYGTIEEDVDFFRKIDPLHYADQIKAPMLVFHGLNDSRVPVQESIQFVMGMKDRRQDVDLTIFNDEGHFTDKFHNHLQMNRQIVQFMKRHLLH